MSYVSLYRKYRPQSFAEVVGQPHVTRTLVNALAEGRVHHAYLFTGPRGTGKTSTARILAKAINCEQGPTPEPCQTCPNCVAISEGSSVDVVELDMASHGGVDDARELRERALFAPAGARRKVYILDEVHMASSAAFNALLKLLEEPPGHVLFAMATTDPQKVLPTILSRVQRLDLRRVPAGELAAHVRRVAERESARLADGAVEAVVRAGDGSVRDTLSVLEQVLSFTGGEVTADDVAQLLGHTPGERTEEAVALVAARDLAGLLNLVQELLDAGHDLRRFALDLCSHLRDLLVLKVAPDRLDLVDATAERRDRLAAQTGLVDQDFLVGAIDLLAGAVAEMRRGPARLPLEIALAKLAVAGAATHSASPAPRPDVVAPPRQPRPVDEEARPRPADEEARQSPPADEEARPRPADESSPAAAEESSPAAAEESSPAAAEESSPAAAETFAAPAAAAETSPAAPAPAARGAAEGGLDRWEEILDAVKANSVRLHALVRAGRPLRLDGDTLVIGFNTAFHAEEVAKPDHAKRIAEITSRVCGRPVRIATLLTDAAAAPHAGSAPNVSDPAAPPGTTKASDDAEPAAEPAELPADSGSAPDEAAAAALLRQQLGAEPLQER